MEQQWQIMAEEIMATGVDFIHLESELKTKVIHFLNQGNQSVILPDPSPVGYWNVLEFSPEVFSREYNQELSAAVFLRDTDCEKPLDLFKKIYFSPSTNLSERKKNLLRRTPGIQVDFGVDPYSLGLWKSLIFKSSVLPDGLLDCLSDGFSVKESLGTGVKEVRGKTGKGNDFGSEKFSCRVFRLSGLAFDLAGAGSIQQLAIVLAAFVQLVEDYEGWWNVEDLFRASSFEISLNSHFFLGVAKIGALRLLIKKTALAYGLKQVESPVFTLPSPRYLSTREPHNNLLRLTVMNMAAMMGGASGFINLTHDLYSHNRGGVLSRNRDILLQKEAFVSLVEDPLFGSYSMDHLVESMARKAWCFFQEITGRGGLCRCLQSGWLQEEIRRENDNELRSFREGRKKMTGVNEFVLPRALSDEYPLVGKRETSDIESWWSRWIFREDTEALYNVKKLIPVQISRIFEDWQFRADTIRETHPDQACLRVWVEPGLENSQRWTKLVQCLCLGGLEVSADSHRPCHPLISIVLALDPENSFCREKLKSLTREQKNLCLWVGEKKQEDFHDFIGESSDRFSLFEKIFNVLEKKS